MSFGLPLSFAHLDKLVSKVEHLTPTDVASDEDFWAAIRADYKLKPDYINLENGYYCFMPQETLEHYLEHLRYINYEASYYLRTVQWENQDRVNEKLASIVGCTKEELIITRNTTESLDMVIGGMHWEEGDEAVMAEQDYGAMLNHFDYVGKRYGVVNRRVSIPNHPKDDQELVDLYASAITYNTRLLMICHLVNITGQVLPVRKICDMAHERGVQVMVDGAHAFSHLDFQMKDLDCDYYGASLHKWLSVPLGAGMLYVKTGNVSDVWPLMAEGGKLEPDNIKNLNHTGTHPVATHLAISNAIDYQNKIGLKRKEARLKYLQHYWTSKVRDLPGVMVNTPADMDRHGAIGNVGIEGIEPRDLSKRLLEEYKIWTVAINRIGVKGVRITPNVYTTTNELDQFVSAITQLSGN